MATTLTKKWPKFGEKHQHAALAEIPIRHQGEDLKGICKKKWHVSCIRESEVQIGTGGTHLSHCI